MAEDNKDCSFARKFIYGFVPVNGLMYGTFSYCPELPRLNLNVFEDFVPLYIPCSIPLLILGALTYLIGTEFAQTHSNLIRKRKEKKIKDRKDREIKYLEDIFS